MYSQKYDRRSLLRKAQVLLPIMTVLASPAYANPAVNSQVAQSNNLAFLSTDISPPNIWNQITPEHSPNQWIRIPDWLGGTWCSFSNIQMDNPTGNHRGKRRSTLTIEVSRLSELGMQKDRLGHIWHYTNTPYERLIQLAGMVEKEQVDKISVFKESPKQFSVLSISTITQYDQTGKLIRAFKEESINTYELVQEGLVRTSISLNDYNERNKLIDSSRLTGTEIRIAPFEVTDQNEQVDYRLKFKDFLGRNHMQNLEPEK